MTPPRPKRTSSLYLYQDNQAQIGRMAVPRKYLGDPADPHFIPSSPILSRQSFTLEQEEALKRSCEQALAGVVTSDEPDGGVVCPKPTQIVVKQTKYCETDRPVQPQRSFHAVSDNSSKIHRYSSRHAYDMTATPSLTSKRTTIDRTTTSTPATMLSEGVRRPSSTRQNSKPYKANITHAILDACPEAEQRKKLATAKSMTCLASAHFESEQLTIALAAAELNQISVSHFEYNKSLPSLPHLNHTSCPEKHGAGFTRMFKLAKSKKTTPVVVQTSYSTPSKTRDEQISPSTTDSKKNKFQFSHMFDRKRRRQQPHQVAVA